MAKRPVQPMPDDIAAELEAAGVIDEYDERPFYHRNDYLGWIADAKRPDTRRKRIDQMLDELKEGGVFMGMEHPPSRRA